MHKCSRKIQTRSSSNTHKLQSSLSTAARLIGGIPKIAHISGFIQNSLHSLPIQQCIHLKPFPVLLWWLPLRGHPLMTSTKNQVFDPPPPRPHASTGRTPLPLVEVHTRST